jgi:hypothetical protein
LLIAMMDENPAAALQLSIAASSRAALSADVQALVDHPLRTEIQAHR